MKNVFFLILMAIPVFASGQSFVSRMFSTVNDQIDYTNVVYVDKSLKASDLYENAMAWLSENLSSSKDFIQTSDKKAGLIIAKGFYSKVHNSLEKSPKEWFKLKLEFKDGRYRYSLYEVRYEYTSNIMGNRVREDKSLEEWINSHFKPGMSDKRLKNKESNLRGFCITLDRNFEATISSLKKGMTSSNGGNNW